MASSLLNAYPVDPRAASAAVSNTLALASENAGNAASVERGQAPVKLLDQKHPDYELNVEAWIDLQLLKESGVLIKKKAERLLQKRPREDPDVYNARKERFSHQPILGTALGWYEAAMFKDDPQFFFTEDESRRDLSDKQLKFYKQDFLGNCDGNHTPFVDFSKRAFADMLSFGVSHVLVDLPRRDSTEELTFQQETDMGFRDPFLVCYSPMEVINWKVDRTGAYEWVVIKTSRFDQAFLSKPQVIDTWYYFDRVICRIYEDRKNAESVPIPSDSTGRTAKLIHEGTHALSHVKRVPVRSLRFSNNLWLANRAYLLLRDHLNQDNSLGWALFMSNLAIPVIIGDVDTTNMVESEVGYLQFPQGTQYKWSEPEGKSFEISAQRLETLREEAYRCMYLQSQGMSMRATPQMQSGRSKLVSMVPTHEVLSGMGNDFRQRLQDIFVDVKDARRESTVQPDVRGFDYEDDMSTEEVFAVTSLLSLRIPSITFERWIYKKVIKAWARDVNPKTLENMYVEVDKGPTIDDRADEDLKNRMDLTRAGMSKAISMKLGGSSSLMPPGRGGNASAPPPVNVSDYSSATI